MYIYDVLQKENVYQSVIAELRVLGIKYRPKKSQTSSSKNDTKSSGSSKDQKLPTAGCKRTNSIFSVFKKPLSNLSLDAVDLQDGTIIHVPIFLIESVAIISQNMTVDGLFRRSGSSGRQQEIISQVDNGFSLTDKYHAIDVANCLKTFFRDMPEPLIPYSFHDMFLRCGMLKSEKEQTLLMACLLLPSLNLNTLAYLMRFLKEVAKHEKENRMGIDNIVKVFAPNIMPVEGTDYFTIKNRMNAHFAVIKILIENAEQIGIVPEQIANIITGDSQFAFHGSDPHLYTKFKKKKQRSGSLTRKPHLNTSNLNLRMLSGLKKMVGKNNPAAESELTNSHPELSNPCLYASKKRKALDVPSEPSESKKNPVPEKSSVSKVKSTANSARINSANSARINSATSARINSVMQLDEPIDKNKKMRLSLEKLVHKGKNKIIKNDEKPKASENVCIDRRWSSASNSSSPRKQQLQIHDSAPLRSFYHGNDIKRLPNIYDDDTFMNADVNLSDNSGDLSNESQIDDKLKYKTIKRHSLNNLTTKSRSRSALKYKEESPDDCDMKRTKSIDSVYPQYRSFLYNGNNYAQLPSISFQSIQEKRISDDESQSDNITSDSSNLLLDSATDVQSEYEKTLKGANIDKTMSADLLAKRMSRELKIRKSTENKIFRSPSARKIGSIRRRSQEKLPRRRVSRTNSWNSMDETDAVTPAPSTSFGNHSHALKDANIDRAIDPPAVTTYNSDANLLQCVEEQLQTLISRTKEHTQMSPSDNSATLSPSPAENPQNDAIYRTPVTTKYFNQRMNELKRSHKVNDSPRTGSDSENWRDGGKYFTVDGTQCTPVPQTGRASIAKLRAQNAGMVLAKAKLFDATQESTSCSQRFARNQANHQSKPSIGGNSTPPIPPPRKKRKINSPKAPNNRNRSFAESDKSSPKRVLVDQKENGTTQEVDNCKTPHIKKPLMTRTPRSTKMVRRIPVDCKRTPMKAVPITPKRKSPAVRQRH